MDAVLNYPIYYEMMDVFQRGYSMRNLANKYLQMVCFPGKKLLLYTLRDENSERLNNFLFFSLQKEILGDRYHFQGTFVDNHDNSRFLCNESSWRKLENYIALTLTMEVSSCAQFTIPICGFALLSPDGGLTPGARGSPDSSLMLASDGAPLVRSCDPCLTKLLAEHSYFLLRNRAGIFWLRT